MIASSTSISAGTGKARGRAPGASRSIGTRSRAPRASSTSRSSISSGSVAGGASSWPSSPDLYGTDARSLYVGVSGWIPLSGRFALRPGVGTYRFSGVEEAFYPGAPDGYAHFGVELFWSARELEISLGWSGTDGDADLLFGAEGAESRFVASLRFGQRWFGRGNGSLRPERGRRF